MLDFNKVYEDNFKEVNDWCDNFYLNSFGQYLNPIHDIYEKLKLSKDKLSDDELEYILTDTPLSLFSVSYKLNDMKTDKEVLKLKIKEKKMKLKTDNVDNAEFNQLSKSEQTEFIDNELLEDNILYVAMSGIISRVETELTFARELIMSCKKIWDRRKDTDDLIPISAIETDHLPDYQEEGAEF